MKAYISNRYKNLAASLHFTVEEFPGTEEEALELLRYELTESVRLRLRSDVEVGIYMSGGIDSAIVTRLIRDVSNHTPSTFSLRFDDARYDESAEQEELARFIGTRRRSISVSHKDIAEHFAQAVFHAEVPAFRTAFFPMYLLSRMVRDSGIKVVLSGEGTDASFLGYDIFK